MGLEKIIISKEVADYFEKLVFALFENEYFGFVETAIDYVDEIIDFIYTSITIYPPQKTPDKLKHFGKFYMVFLANSRTTWYIFYEFEETKNVYLVTGILNNHLPELQFLNL